LVKTTLDISGPKCLESFGKLNPSGLWAKTWLELLVGQTGWYSKRCILTWKLKATPYKRLYFQLQVSALPTDAIESGLLLTPTTCEQVQDLDKFKERMEKYPNGTTMPNLATQVNQLWPTPTSVQRDHPERVLNLKLAGGTTITSRKSGENRPNSILDMAMFTGLLPTPTSMEDRRIPNGSKRDYKLEGNMNKYTYAEKLGVTMMPTPSTRDYKGARTTEALEEAGRNETNSLPDYFAQPGMSSQLNPRFVAEMMGFPPNWLELPFLSTETSPSKPTAMP
jgi:hypothetical protein